MEIENKSDAHILLIKKKKLGSYAGAQSFSLELWVGADKSQ